MPESQASDYEEQGATVYPAQVKGEKPYILFKQKNMDDTHTVACTND